MRAALAAAQASCLWVSLLAAEARPDLNAMPTNSWVVAEDAKDGGTAAGIAWLPEQKGVFLWGIRARKDWRGHTLSERYWTELFHAETGKWEEWVPQAGRLEAGLPRGSYFTEWVKKDGYEMPALPHHNVGFWHAHQSCYLPDEKKLLYFLGGVTFKYDPAKRAFENMNLPFGQAPPDVMLGSMAWDPINKEAILFGGGYLRAYQAKPGDVKQSRPPDAWTPDRWDRRGTWAYDPAKNQWRQLVTAPQERLDAHQKLVAFNRRLDALIGVTRLSALEIGRGTDSRFYILRQDGCSADLAQLGLDLEAFAAKQATAASDLIRATVAPKVMEGGVAVRCGQGWEALHALDAARDKLIEAEEALAPAPRPRHYARMVYDPKAKKIVLWGGDGEDRYLADTWLLDCQTRRWERCRPALHPAPSKFGMVAMDYDAKHGLVVLAQQTGEVWTFDAAKQEWQRLDVALGGFGRKGYPPTGWVSLDYDPERDVHVLVDMVGQSRKTLLLRLDPTKVAEAKPGAPEEVWRDDKYQRAWSHLPKTQAEYRQRVAEHEKLLAAVPPNAWTEIKCDYSGWGRAYGSFCTDWDRDQIVLWGGGHSAYMGNEVSQYDLKGNLWMESWNPEFPPHPYGCPDGPGWHPSFTHEKGTHHGYHHYVYCTDLKRIAFFGGTLQYDPDAMRYAPDKLRKVGEGAIGMAVEMNGAPGLLTVSTRHWYGQPFGIWQADFKANTLSRIPGSDTPFGANDRFKAVFDTKRRRVLCYGAVSGQSKKCNELWAFPLDAGKWEKLEPAGAEAPAIEHWNYCYSSTHDCLLIADKQATWVYDCGKNLWRKLDCKPGLTEAGVVYSARHDLFYLLDGHGYRPQQVWVFRYQP
ncbi:MAG TPA: kelch repeat-containing protein [Planctomycetota bacterium]|nr:kelch repeat-containing protein [Planctomycetota bacterium]